MNFVTVIIINHLRLKIIIKINPNLNRNDLKEILKESIIFKRIECTNIFQGITNYFIINKFPFLEMDFYEVNIF